ncbi:HD domain-containing protein [Brevibacillus sp. H7]|uniref:HD domain-containing protein n=1 Tax=Brevibacillus sp. H7 TaxID=3349138 RepID=UPI0037FBD9B7
MHSSTVITDPLYGTWNVDGVLAELLLSRPVQRLKRIHQGGASYLVNPIWNVTRYEHSVGVMLLLRKLGAGLEEQIMGLLHDVSHTAFSHVADLVFQNQQEDFHEQIFEQVVLHSDVPEILDRHGLQVTDLFQKSFPLLDRQLPGLSADRIDYTLRDMYSYGKTTKREVDQFLESLIVQEGIICTDSIPRAEWFVQLFYQEVIEFFLDPLNLYGYEMLSQAIRLSLEKGVLNREHLLLDDETVMGRMKESGDPQIVPLLERIHPRVRVTESKTNYQFHRINKLRTIDPDVLIEEGRLIRASEASNRVKIQTEQARKRALAGTYVKVLDW